MPEDHKLGWLTESAFLPQKSKPLNLGSNENMMVDLELMTRTSGSHRTMNGSNKDKILPIKKLKRCGNNGNNIGAILNNKSISKAFVRTRPKKARKYEEEIEDYDKQIEMSNLKLKQKAILYDKLERESKLKKENNINETKNEGSFVSIPVNRLLVDFAQKSRLGIVLDLEEDVEL